MTNTNNFNEIEFTHNNVSCTFNLIIFIVKKLKNIEINISIIKQILFEKYSELLPKYSNKIMTLLIEQGKKSLGNLVKNKQLTFEQFIYNNGYFLTTLDLWILVIYYKIPTYFISSKYLMETNYTSRTFLAYSHHNTNNYSDINKHIYILIPGLRANNVPNFRLIYYKKSMIYISQSLFSEKCRRELLEHQYTTLNNYLTNYVRNTKTFYIKKKPIE